MKLLDSSLFSPESIVSPGSAHVKLPSEGDYMDLLFIGRERQDMTYIVYSLAIYVLAAVVDGRCVLRLKSILKLCKYNWFKLK